MPVPDYQTPMLPILRLFAAGETSVTDCLPELKQEFQISDEEAAKLMIDHGVGVRPMETIVLSELDENFFAEE